MALPSTRPEDEAWDPGTVEAGAERAVEDPTAVAYLGEADSGASAVSLPVTNRAGIVQVSPTDGLTSLTRPPPGRPRAGPERYYPEERRTFVRLVPSDLDVADAMLGRLTGAAGRRVAIVHTEGVAERELAGMLAVRLRRAGRAPVLIEPLRDDPESAQGLLEDLVMERPGAILLAARDGGEVRALLAMLAERLPSAAVVAGPGLASRPRRGKVPNGAEAVTGLLPAPMQPRAGRRLLRSLGETDPHALYGYDGMAFVLDAIDAGGPDRDDVIAAALRPGRRDGVTGRYAVSRDGAARGRRLAVVQLGPGDP